MHFVALVSGGKDSVYALTKAIHFGHKLICIANLCPKERDEQELNSFFIQTVGHHIVEKCFSECLGVPLVQHPTSGKSKQKGLKYEYVEENEDEEVEDLFALLSEVKRKYPDVQAVSSGAIFSDYQRIRIEHVCARLGLVSLSYLWRENQSSLLQEMIDSELNAIILKTASLGLNPKKHCGKSLSEMQSWLEEKNEEFGLNVCGEGGEYETLVLDSEIFKKKIVIDESDVIIESDDDFSPVGYLLIKKFHSEDSSIPQKTESLSNQSNTPIHIYAPKKPPSLSTYNSDSDSNLVSIRKNKSELALELSVSFSKKSNQSEKEQIRTLLNSLMSYLHENKYTLEDLLRVSLTVRDMNAFSSINQEYEKYFYTNPPSRACVEVSDLPNHVELTCILKESDQSKFVLHVQSISNWAPSCIGPYSQATESNGVVYMAGMIALVPATMAMFQDEHKQIQQNVSQVLCAMNSKIANITRCVIFYQRERGIPELPDLLIDTSVVSFEPVTRLPKDATYEYLVDAVINTS